MHFGVACAAINTREPEKVFSQPRIQTSIQKGVKPLTRIAEPHHSVLRQENDDVGWRVENT